MPKTPEIANTQTAAYSDARAVFDILAIVQPGEIVEYDFISGLIRRNILKSPHVLARARQMCRDECAMVFEAVRSLGLRRLHDREIVRHAEIGSARISRAARREAQKLMCVQDFGALPREDRARQNALLASFGAVAHFSSAVGIQKIESRVSGATQQTIDLKATLEAFGK